MRPPLAALSPTPLMDCSILHVNKTCWEWNFWLIFAHKVEHAHTFSQNFSNWKLSASEKSYGCWKIGHFHTFYSLIAGRSLFTFSLENLARIGGFGCIFDIFNKKVPGNIAATRLKIGCTYAQLQPFKATSGWNLNQLFWPLSRWRQTFGLVCLVGQ